MGVCAVFCLTLFVCLYGVHHYGQRQIETQRIQTMAVAENHLDMLDRGIRQALSATHAMAALVKQGNGQIQNFDAVASHFIELYPGIGALQLAPGGVIRHSHPLVGNEKAIGHDLLADPQRNKEAFLARDTARLTIAGPFSLVQGGMGAVGRFPVFLNDAGAGPQFWGFTTVLIKFPEMLERVGFDDLRVHGYDFLLWRTHPDSGLRQVIGGSIANDLTEPVDLVLEVPNGKWVLSVAPQAGWGDREETGTYRVLAVLVSVLLAGVAGLFLSYPIALQSEVVRRTQELKDNAEQLRIAATAFESQDAMTITNADRIILKVNQAFTRITGYREEEVLGQTPAILQSGRQDGSFYASMWAELSAHGYWQGEIWNRRKNGEIYPERLSISAVKDDSGKVTHYVGAFSDISRDKQAEEEIQFLAFNDPLTGLPNRRLLMDRLRQTRAVVTRKARQGGVMLIDLDNFKVLNDTLGHAAGDALLCEVGQRLVASLRQGDTVARLGGDEFVLVLDDLSGKADEAAKQARDVGEKILRELSRPYVLEGSEVRSTPSIGVALFGPELASNEEVLKQAELAMYRAKEAGRSSLYFFDPQMQEAVSRRVALESEMRQALSLGQFVLHYQAQVDQHGQVLGAEALLRWQHPQRGMVSPLEFIPLAEETGIILPLGYWVIETACRCLVAWAQHPVLGGLSLAVNVSARQFRHPDFVDQVMAVIEHTGAASDKLKLELTESLLVDNVEDAIAKMAVLKRQGVSFSLDDFGTGYSSLSYLKQMPFDQLKIDRSFVADMLTDANDAAISGTIVALGQCIGLHVIAEGVETKAQQEFLGNLGCHAYQGYLFCRPLPVDEFEAFVLRCVHQ